MFLLELSSHASAELEQRIRFVGSSVREGVKVEMSRRSTRAPLRIEVIETPAEAEKAPLHEWVTPLMAVFGLPPLRPLETINEYGGRVGSMVLARANLVAGQLQASAAVPLTGR
jgi:hypothetical protein